MNELFERSVGRRDEEGNPPTLELAAQTGLERLEALPIGLEGRGPDRDGRPFLRLHVLELDRAAERWGSVFSIENLHGQNVITAIAESSERLAQIGDDRGSTVVTLPFTFKYYGAEYNALRVDDNGWVAFDLASWYDIRNWNMPDKWGSACQIAPF